MCTIAVVCYIIIIRNPNTIQSLGGPQKRRLGAYAFLFFLLYMELLIFIHNFSTNDDMNGFCIYFPRLSNFVFFFLKKFFSKFNVK